MEWSLMGGRQRGQTPREGGSFCFASALHCEDEKRQIFHRLPADFVRQTLADFNANVLGASEACHRLGVGKSRLYQLRTLWLKDRQALRVESSGGDRRQPWPEQATAFLREFLPLQTPPNYQLVADELLRLHGLRRARSTVEAYVKAHLPHLVPSPQRKPRTYRRFTERELTTATVKRIIDFLPRE